MCTASTPFAGLGSEQSWNGWGPDIRNTGFPAHVASDEDKFAEIFKRLAVIEKTIQGHAR